MNKTETRTSFIYFSNKIHMRHKMQHSQTNHDKMLQNLKQSIKTFQNCDIFFTIYNHDRYIST